MYRFAKLVVLFPLLVVSVYAQEKQPIEAQQEQRAAVLRAFTDETSSASSEKNLELGIRAFPCAEEKADEQVHNSCLAAKKAYYDYYAAGLPRRTRVYEWNNVSTKVIFGVVLFLVGVGVFFSWKQFFGVTLEKTAAGVEVSEIEFGLGGIKVKSPFLGVILLALSLAFFYLYLQYVYPVVSVF